MGFDDAVLRCLSKYAIFSGRARPSEFWWFMTLYLAVAGLTLVTLTLSVELATVAVLVTAVLTPPAVSVTVRRLHDIGLTVALEHRGIRPHPMDEAKASFRCVNLIGFASRLDVDLLPDEDGAGFLRRILPPDAMVFWPADRF